MRLSLRESRIRGRGHPWVVGNPGDAGANVGHPWGVGDRGRLEGEGCGIPHLAKNERDVGHPAFVAGIGPKSALLPASRLLGMTKGDTNVRVIVLLGFRLDRCLRF
jgi:hypothetical protein